MTDDADGFDIEPPAPKSVNAIVTRTTPEQRADEAIADAVEFADVKLALSEMVYFVDTEIHRIEGEQRARLLAGMLVHPLQDQIERIARWRSVMNFLTACNERPGEAAERFARIAKARRPE